MFVATYRFILNGYGMVMPKLTEHKWKNIAEGFKNRANFPYCLGTIDGKHVRLKKPRNTGSSYYNYKKYF